MLSFSDWKSDLNGQCNQFKADFQALMVKRELVKNELTSWFGYYYENIQIAFP